MLLAYFFFPTIVALTALFFLGDYIVKFISELGGKQAATTAFGRLEQYEFAWKLILESPIIGVKAKTYETYPSLIDHSHNLWLKVFVQGGLVSLIPLVLLLVNAFRKAFKNLAKNSFQEKYVASVFIFCMFVSTQFNPSGTFVFWVMLSVSSSITWVCIQDVRPKTEVYTMGRY